MDIKRNIKRIAEELAEFGRYHIKLRKVGSSRDGDFGKGDYYEAWYIYRTPDWTPYADPYHWNRKMNGSTNF